MRSRNQCCRGEQINITYSECVSVALVIQHAKRKHSIVLSSVVCPALPHFSRFSHKRHDFRKKRYLHKMFALIFSTICGNKMPTRRNRGFYCRSYCLLNMFRAPPCPSSRAQEYYTVIAACGISCGGFQVAGLVWS